MEILIALAVVWLVVVVIGHGSWVLLRMLFNAIFQSPDSDPRLATAQKNSRPQTDLQAGYRVTERLLAAELIDHKLAEDYRRGLRNLALGQSTSTIHPLPHSARADAQAGFAPPSVARPSTVMPSSATPPAATPPAALPPAVLPATKQPDDEIVMASLVSEEANATVAPTAPLQDRREQDRVGVSPPAPRTQEPAASVLSPSEIIGSFLAAHNIRWGELVAGMLIVICSIGLVISLWNPLVETHPVIPSLLFLAANAAIYAAGLYTLSRWRLRHTSRAVLVIATLLVPLSVLAGLAAAGRSVDAISLIEPITLAAIAVAGLIYSTLLWLGGKALARPQAGAITIAVAGPVAVLPLMPAAVRTWYGQAGWVVMIASVAAAGALLWMTSHRRKAERKLGNVASRGRLLVMGFAAFAMAVTTSYAVFAVRAFGFDAFMVIAITSIPALLAMSAAGQSLMRLSRSSTHSMVGAIVAVIAIGMCAAMLPAAMAEARWVGSWAIACSLSGLLAGAMTRQSQWLAVSTLPVGIATIANAPTWTRGLSWDALTFWQRFLSGEAMLAAVALGIAIFGLSRLVSSGPPRRWLETAATSWVLVAQLIAAVLTLAPSAWLGTAHPYTLTAILAAGAAVTVLLASRHENWSAVTIVLISLAAAGRFTLYEWVDGSIVWGTATTWITAGLFIAAALILLAEFSPRWRRLQSVAMRRSGEIWLRNSVAAALLAAIGACFTIHHENSITVATLATAAALVLWAATRSRDLTVMRLAQLISVAWLVAFAFRHYPAELFTPDSWKRGVAPWGWSIAAASLAGVWMGLRYLARFNLLRIGRRLRFLRCSDAAPLRLVDGPLLITAAAFLSVGSIREFGKFVLGSAGFELATAETLLLCPLAALLLSEVISFAARTQASRETSLTTWDWVRSVIAACGCVWVACWIADQVATESVNRLIVATSLASVACLATLYRPDHNRASDHRRDSDAVGRPSSLLVAVAGTLVFVSSSVLLSYEWFVPIDDNGLAQATPTIAVALWWLIGSAAAWWGCRVNQENRWGIVSAALFASAAALLVPVWYQTSPVAWVQVAAIASIAWAGVTARFSREEEATNPMLPAIRGSLGWAMVMGIVSAVAVSIHGLFHTPGLHSFVGSTGAILSACVVALAVWAHWSGRVHSGLAETLKRELSNVSSLSWPLGISLLAGQLTWAAERIQLINAASVPEATLTLLVVASVASLFRLAKAGNRGDGWHAGLISLTCLVIAFESTVVRQAGSDWMIGIGIASAVTAGLLALTAARLDPRAALERGSIRLLGWAVVILGAAIFVSVWGSSGGKNADYGLPIAWAASWVVVWRIGAPDAQSKPKVLLHSLPDPEFAWALLGAALFETLLKTGSAGGFMGMAEGPWFAVRVIAYVAVAASVAFRAGRSWTWAPAITTALLSGTLVALHLATGRTDAPAIRVMLAALTPAMLLALGVHLIPSFVKVVRQIRPRGATVSVGRLARETLVVAVLLAMAILVLAMGLLVDGAATAILQLTILGMALVAWSVAELADLTSSGRLRHLAATLGLITIGLLASVPMGEATAFPLLAASMRWLVASVLTIPALLFVVPRLLGTVVASRWKPALQRSAMVSALAATGSLATMLSMEWAVRTETGIAGLSITLVVGVGFTLAALSLIAGTVAILSGKEGSRLPLPPLNDRQRRVLIVATQVIAGTAWLHLFLCKADWAMIGLRHYWPYLVMAMAFASVGATEWARRRGDAVLADTLRHTALYLPLIPVVGFWISGAWGEVTWLFRGGQVRYDLLLALGAIYYVMLSAMWKRAIPRIAAVVLGNAALWVALVQQPDWGFLVHPQAWLIPPAVCVLAVAQSYRDRLAPMTLSAVRYATTLVIYLSSTADMLLQQVGTHIMGPIVLVVLALIGMLAGVVLQVRPFLYLGASFVFIGVTSMVWHAQRWANAAWPWWVFGITTGIFLLAGLMALEKNKNKLRRYAHTLATWEG